ncbi:MAG: hypothetical protein ACKO5Z_02740 [Burkholderiaceae bacterium]
MNEIYNETVEATAESIFSFDLFNQVDEEDADELETELSAEDTEEQTPAPPLLQRAACSLLESTNQIAPCD